MIDKRLAGLLALSFVFAFALGIPGSVRAQTEVPPTMPVCPATPTGTSIIPTAWLPTFDGWPTVEGYPTPTNTPCPPGAPCPTQTSIPPTITPTATITITPTPTGDNIQFTTASTAWIPNGIGTIEETYIPGKGINAFDLYGKVSFGGQCDWGNGTTTVGCPALKWQVEVKNMTNKNITLNWIVQTENSQYYSPRVNYYWSHFYGWTSEFTQYILPEAGDIVKPGETRYIIMDFAVWQGEQLPPSSWHFTNVVGMVHVSANPVDSVYTPTPMMTPTPLPCQMGSGDDGSVDGVFTPPIFIPGQCYTIVPAWNIPVPASVQELVTFAQLPEDIGIPGVQVCTQFLSMTLSLFGFNVMNAFSVLVSFVCVLIIYRMFRE